MNLKFPLCTAILGATLLAPSVQAQPAPKTPETGRAPLFGARKPTYIRLQNVPANLMAYWLDPTRQNEPVQLQSSRNNRQRNPLILDKANPKIELPRLPAGVERIVAIDPRNTLLVFGTPESIAELEKVVAQFDKPLRQVEIEAQFWQIAPKDAAQLGISLASDPQKRYRSLPVGADALVQLKEWAKNDQTRLISAPRVLALNRLTANLESQTSTPVTADIKARAVAGKSSLDLSGADGQQLIVTNRSGLTATPTFGEGDSIALQLAPASILQVAFDPYPSKSSDKTPQEMTPDERQALARARQEAQVTISERVLEGALIETTVRNGQSIALTGFTSRFFDEFLPTSTKPVENVVVIVTARIVRRAGDEVKTVALQR